MDEVEARNLINEALQQSPVVEAMNGVHEIFLSLLDGGFTEKQALYIVAQGLFGSPSNDST